MKADSTKKERCVGGEVPAIRGTVKAMASIDRPGMVCLANVSLNRTYMGGPATLIVEDARELAALLVRICDDLDA